MTFINHCNANRVSESHVAAVPAPDFTPTWHPFSHGEVVRAMDAAVDNIGVGVREREYSMNKKGTRVFSVWKLDVNGGGTGLTVGMRNSIDKSFGLGLCGGTDVFVCDNLAFSASYVAFKMHTAGLTIETLETFVQEAFATVIGSGRDMIAWQESLQDVWVPKQDYKALVFDMVDNGVFAGGQIQNYLTCLDEEKALRRGHVLDGTTSLYNMHGAATRLMRNWSLLRTSEATPKLAEVCDDYMMRRAA